MVPNRTTQAIGIRTIDPHSMTFATADGFSNECAEFGPKNPPPFADAPTEAR